MKSIFDLIPESQQAAFAERLDAMDEAQGHAGAGRGLLPPRSRRSRQRDQVQVIGQDPVVESVVQTAFRRARLGRPHKPVAVFLLVGSTGSGKTELAKALVSTLFGGNLIRIDCNEMSEKASVARLVSSPPGYIGSEQGSQFAREIGRLGSGVVLFDEIEKAHPDVVKSIMSLLDEARITGLSTSRTRGGS